jgi:hypothetical protein
MDAHTDNIYSIFRDKLLLVGEHVLNAVLEHSVTPTYQKGEMTIRAHEKIGMGEVKIYSVLLRD